MKNVKIITAKAGDHPHFQHCETLNMNW